ncbi:uncharacterized protein LOC134254336 isoform X2 [Saccostrea cucullata]|uniref:uncharacterized protein LOC134254336 isoform X2 n=1 Tax=Saccostrea cuccullata TaxID=36930 RepID=UPI002ED01E26
MDVSDNQNIFWRFCVLTVASWFVLPVYSQGFHGAGTQSHMHVSPSRYGAVNPSAPSGQIIPNSAFPEQNSVKYSAKRNAAKPGLCPSVVLMTSKKCPDACGDDNDCAGMTKCCRNGCGKKCTEPEIPAINPVSSAPTEQISNKSEIAPVVASSLMNSSHVYSNNPQSTEAPPNSGPNNQQNQSTNGHQNINPVGEPSFNNHNRADSRNGPIPFSFRQVSTGGSNSNNQNQYPASHNLPPNPMNREILHNNFRGGPRNQPSPEFGNSARNFDNYPPGSNGMPYNSNYNGGFHNQQGFQNFVPMDGSSTVSPRVMGSQNHNMDMYSGQSQYDNPNEAQQGYQHNNSPRYNPMGGYDPANTHINQQGVPSPQFDSYNNPPQGPGGPNQYSNSYPVGASSVQSGNQYSDPLGGSNVQAGPSNQEFASPVGGTNSQQGPQNNQHVNQLGETNFQPNPPYNQYSHHVGGSNVQSGPPNSHYFSPVGGSNTQPGPQYNQPSSAVGGSNPSNNQHSLPVGGSYNAPHDSPSGYPGFNTHVVGSNHQPGDTRSGSNAATYNQPHNQAPEFIQNSQQNLASNYEPASGSNQNGASHFQQGPPRVEHNNQYDPEIAGMNHYGSQPGIPYDSPSQSQNTYKVQSPHQQQQVGGSNIRYDNAPSRQNLQSHQGVGPNSNNQVSYSVPMYQTTPLYDARDGFCPKPRGGGVCQDDCYLDSECPTGRKCCSNGCGRMCMVPVFVRSQPIRTAPEAIQIPLKQEHQVQGNAINSIDPHSLNLIEIRPYSVGESHSAVQILPYDHSGGHYDVGHENTIYNELVNGPPQYSEAYTSEPQYIKSGLGRGHTLDGLQSDKANVLPGSAVKLKPSVFGSYKIIPFNMEKIRRRNSGISNQSGGIQNYGPEVHKSRSFDVRKPETKPRTSHVNSVNKGQGRIGSEPWNMGPKVQGGQRTFKQSRTNVQSPNARMERHENYNTEQQNTREQNEPQRKIKQYPEVKRPQRTLPNHLGPEVNNEQQRTTAGVIPRVNQIRPSVDGPNAGGGNVVRKTNPNTFKIRESHNHNGALKITPLEAKKFASQRLQASNMKTVEKSKMQNFQRVPPLKVKKEGPKVKYTTTREIKSTGRPESTYAGPQQPSPAHTPDINQSPSTGHTPGINRSPSPGLTPSINRSGNLRLTATEAPVRDPGVNQKGEINLQGPKKRDPSHTDPVKEAALEGPNMNLNPVNSIDYKHGYRKNIHDPMVGPSAPQELNPSNQFEAGMIRPMPKSGGSFSLTGGGKDPGSNMYTGSEPLQYNAANLGISDYGHPKASAFESQPIRRQWLGQSLLGQSPMGQSSSHSMLSISKIYHDIGHSRAIMEPPKPYEFSSEFRLRVTERPIPTYRPPVNSLGQVYIDIAGFSDNSLKAPHNPMKLSSGVPGHIPEIETTTTPPPEQSTVKESLISNTTDKVISNSLLKNPKPTKSKKPKNQQKYIPAGMVLARGANESLPVSDPKPSPSAPRLGISSTLIGSAPVAPSADIDSRIVNREGFNLFTGYKPQYRVPVKEIRNPSLRGTPVFSARSQKKG